MLSQCNDHYSLIDIALYFSIFIWDETSEYYDCYLQVSPVLFGCNRYTNL